tara:strand:- start:57 stop:1070 length:1014 start_codon:yes stop_codon:yes gene_type:complete
MKNKLYIISNEKISEENNRKFCDNIDIKSIPESLNSFFEVSLLGRYSSKNRTKLINIDQIDVSKNPIHLIKQIVNMIKGKNEKYLVISISPFTFLAILLLKIFGKKVHLYLRSDGFEEYRSILGFLGPPIYGFMFYISTALTKMIACREKLLRNKKGYIVNPSQLNDKWYQNLNMPQLDKIKLLYVGRIRVEKGIFSLIKMIKETKFNLKAVTSEIEINFKETISNISLISYKNIDDSIIKFYDECNIFILPSFTEAHPQVLDEALARLRPVIVFKEISHVVRDRKGVYVVERNLKSLSEKIKYLIDNYEKIRQEMKTNQLPSKENFVNEIKNILNK